MKKISLTINGIPLLLWGESSEKVIIAVHGDKSHKADEVIVILAEEAEKVGLQTLSFDLCGAGERTADIQPNIMQSGVQDVLCIHQYAKDNFSQVNYFGNSMGAFLGLLALADEPIHQTFFLSPAIDMQAILENIMTAFGVTKEMLERERIIKKRSIRMSWEAYQYVLNHPVKWNKPTSILYGELDAVCSFESVRTFAQNTGSQMTVMEGGEHWFHTPQQLAFYREWLRDIAKH